MHMMSLLVLGGLVVASLSVVTVGIYVFIAKMNKLK